VLPARHARRDPSSGQGSSEGGKAESWTNGRSENEPGGKICGKTPK
jgi:hypothetical protein